MSLSGLEALIRRAVYEKVRSVLAEWLDEEPTTYEPGSPLHRDLAIMIEMKRAGALELLSFKEVWGVGNDLSV